MSAAMLLRTVYLLAGTTFDLDAATVMARTLTSQASTDELAWLTDTLDLDHTPDATAAQQRETACARLCALLSAFDESLYSDDVTSYEVGNVGQVRVDEYATGGLSYGDGPTEVYDAWSFLLDAEILPERWAEYLATAGGLLHPNGDGPVVATVAIRAWGHLPA
jgi:hypothetical protein